MSKVFVPIAVEKSTKDEFRTVQAWLSDEHGGARFTHDQTLTRLMFNLLETNASFAAFVEDAERRRKEDRL
jgi:hypothetical protein